ncbi:MAG: nucleoside triphosphate pyrophosphohydrolase [Nitrospirae bacterium]|nr:MAG: nucleoside triphosphate pyrophosphohydrolase [Nitrospirota bacterium]
MSRTIDNLLALMARLRAPDGCPWDRQQTHESLKPHLLEETYEVLEAIDQKSPESLKEELGDLLLQVVFHAQIASERGEFTFDDVVRDLADKLVRRHPHVFHPPDTRPTVDDTEEVLHRWEMLKQQEQLSASPASALEGVPKAAPALQRAYQIQKRAARAGFDWSQAEPVFDKLREECEELVQAIVHAREESRPSQEASSSAHSAIESEFGDVLFSLVNIARFLKINPEEALRVTTNRFIRRFQYLEEQARRQGRPLTECTEAELDQWWEQAKAQERAKSG